MPVLSIPRQVTPSYQSGYARSGSVSVNDSLWKGCRGLWVPRLGNTGLTLLPDMSGFRRNGTIQNIDETDWVTDELGPALEFVRGSPTETGEQVDCGLIPEFDSGPQCTYVCHAFRVGSQRLSIGTQASGTQSWSLLWGSDNNFYTTYADGSSKFSTSTSSHTQVGWHTLALVFDGAATGDANRMRTFIDAVLVPVSYTGSVSAQMPTNANQGQFIFGIDNSGKGSTGRYGVVSIWNRPLLVSELQHLANDPLALVRQKSRIMSFAAAAANDPVGSIIQPDLAVLQSSYF